MLHRNKELISLLREAIASRKGFNKTTLLHPLIDEIQAAQAMGATRKSICEALSEGGIDVPLATLDSILYRYRKKYGRTGERSV